MVLQVKELSSEPTELKEIKGSEWLNESLAGPVVRGAPSCGVEIVVRAHTFGGNVFVSGTLDTSLVLQCARCAVEWVQPAHYPFQLTLAPANVGSKEDAEEVELTKDDVEFTYYSGETIDLDPAIREELILQTPEYPLCAPGCRGLCARCGADLNRGPCACAAVESVDPRLAALKRIKLS
jgi:uncharacterized protein